jgi:hypothetical protein
MDQIRSTGRGKNGVWLDGGMLANAHAMEVRFDSKSVVLNTRGKAPARAARAAPPRRSGAAQGANCPRQFETHCPSVPCSVARGLFLQFIPDIQARLLQRQDSVSLARAFRLIERQSRNTLFAATYA